jgi:hypothetical protein
MAESEIPDIVLRLGDIIQMTTDDESLNNSHFMIEYIDRTLLKLIREDGSVVELQMNDGIFTSVGVTDIIITSRSEDKGYARQHELVPGNMITIIFDNDYKVSGTVIELIEDRIGINIGEDKIYIDFGYKGIPLESSIKTIYAEENEIPLPIDAPTDVTLRPDDGAEDVSLQPISLEDDALQPDETLEDEVLQPDDTPQPEIIIPSGLIFGDTIGKISYEVTAPLSERVFGIEKQTTDMLNGFMSKIPTHKRTQEIMSDIINTIERYTELREQFSVMDGNYQLSIPDRITDSHKPALTSMMNLDRKLLWCIPVTDYKKKIYHEIGEDIDVYRDIQPGDLSDSQGNIVDIMEAYNSNSVPDGINKHYYRISGIDKEFTPLYPPDEDVLYVGDVKVNMFALSDTSGDFMSNVIYDEALSLKRFVGNEYVPKMETRELSKIRGETHVSTVDIIPADRMYIKSMITIPMTLVPFSNVKSGHANICDKVNLDEITLPFWKLFNEGMRIKHVDVSETYSLNNKMDTIVNYRAPIGYTPGPEYFKQFMEAVIPPTNTIIREYSRFTFNNSVYNIVKQLEPFMVDIRDVNYNHYKVLSILTEQFNVKYKENYKRLERVFYAIPNERNFTVNFLKFIIGENAGLLTDAYPSITTTRLANELYTKMMNTDGMLAYNNVIMLLNSELFLNDEQIIEQDKDGSTPIKPDESCDRVLSNAYTTLGELEQDNGKEIYYDRQYDRTLYELTDEFSNEIELLSTKDDINQFLFHKLTEKYGFTPDLAMKEIEYISVGRKQVNVGDYAVLKTDEGDKYFKRSPSLVWEIIDEESGDHMSFCNISAKCISIKDKCVSKDEAKEISEPITEPLPEGNNGFNLDAYINSIRGSIESSTKFAKIINMRRLKERLKYDTGIISLKIDTERNVVLPDGWKIVFSRKSAKYFYSNLVLKLTQWERPLPQLTSIYERKSESPHALLRDEILSQKDFSKKHRDILKFASKYTRPSYMDENPYWFYCVTSGIKLLPVFLVRLGEAHMTGNDYEYILNRIVSEQGTMSGNGSHIVDKHSGYIIMSRPFDTSDGYTDEGFKDISRSIMDDDIADVIMKEPAPEAYRSKEESQINSIINALVKFMSIKLPDDRLGYIVTDSLKLLSDVDNTLRIQASKSEIARQKRPIIYAKSMVIITLSYLHVYIQTTIPTIVSKTSYPGCKKSFGGYPTYDDDTISGIDYISCIANNLKSTIEPWNGISKMGKKSIAENIRGMIEKFILPIPKIKEMVDQRISYHEVDVAQGDVMTSNNMATFLPPLIETSTRAIEAIPDSVMRGITGDRPDGMNVFSLKAKVIQIASLIRESVQSVVRKDVTTNNPILINHLGEPYNQNACCYGIQSPIEYFMDQSSDAKKYHTISLLLTQSLDINRKMNKPKQIFHDGSTKRILKKIDRNIISDRNIYQFIIHRCNYDTTSILPSTLNGVCLPRPPSYDPYSSMDEKISMLKEDGQDYNQDTLDQIHKRTTTYSKFRHDEIGTLNRLMNILYEMNKQDDKIFPVDFLTQMYNIVDPDMSDQYDANVRKMKDYLSKEIATIQENLISMLSSNGMPRKEIQKLNRCLQTLLKFPATGTGRVVDIETETGVREHEFTKLLLNEISVTLPNVIVNGVDYTSIKPPKHWNLSKRHSDDFVAMIKKYYEPMSSLYSNELFSEILSDYVDRARHVHRFISSITYNRSETLKYGIDHVLTDMISRYSIVTLLMKLNELSHLASEKHPLSDRTTLVDMTSRFTTKLLTMICNDKDSINYNYTSLMTRIMRAKEKEKNIMTDYLKDMTEDARKVERVFKQYKLGKWSLGEQKGYRVYEGSMYDKERDDMDQQLQREIMNGSVDMISRLNNDIYDSEQLATMMEDREINDISHIGEDNDNAGNEDDE